MIRPLRHSASVELAVMIIFMAAVSFPLAAMLVRQTGMGLAPVAEVREARLLPSVLALYGRFKAHFETSFGGRPVLVQAHTHLKTEWLGVSPSPRVAIGRDNWLFYTDENEIACTRHHLFSEDQLRSWVSALEHRQASAQRLGAMYVVVVTPDKHTIYFDKLPEQLVPIRAESRLNQLLTYLARHTTVTALDLRPELLRIKATDQVYFRTDTHWNPLGAFVASGVIVSHLGRRFAGVAPHDRNDFVGHRETYDGDLASFLGITDARRETYENFVLRKGNVSFLTPEGASVPSAARLRVPVMQSHMPDAPVAKLLVFRDSFGRALLPYLAPHFRAGTYVWSQFDEATVRQQRPDVVIDQLVERALMGSPR